MSIGDSRHITQDRIQLQGLGLLLEKIQNLAYSCMNGIETLFITPANKGLPSAIINLP